MNNYRIFKLTKLSIILAAIIASIIFFIGIISFILYYVSGSKNLVYTYYNSTGISIIPAIILTALEIVFGFIMFLAIIKSKKSLKWVKFSSIILFIFAFYFLIMFFVFLGIHIFNYFTVQMFAYPAYFLLLLFFAWSFYLQSKNIELILLNHNKNNTELIENKNDIFLSEEEEEDKKEAELFSLNFEKPTLVNKTEEEKIIIKKSWEKIAEKLDCLKYSELKKIASEKNIKVSWNVKKSQLINLLKKIVKINVERKDLFLEKEITINESKMIMFTLTELKNIAKKENIKINVNSLKKDYIKVLRDKIEIIIEFII